MRKIILSLLLASVAGTPAIAGPRDREERQQQSSEDRQKAREERQQAREERQQQVRSERAAMARPQNIQQNGPLIEQRRQQDVQVQQRTPRERIAERRQVSGNETLRRQDRPVPTVLRDRTRTPVVSSVPRRGTQPPLRVEGGRRHGTVNWSTNWRNDRRYDWRRWRDNNRSRFHIGFYYDPFGWGYQPYSVGWRLWPSYYSSRYWINDPWQYRLPYAPAGYRWVRYYDDALLVDTWSGQVVDVLRSFFW